MKRFKLVGCGATAHFQSRKFVGEKTSCPPSYFRDWKWAVAPHASLFWLLAILAAPALAVAHDNIDANRPLDFDDAETIAYRENAIEFGASAFQTRGDNAAVAGSAEFLRGFARNWQLNVGVDPQISSRFDVGNIGIGVQHNFNRETQSSPAFGARADFDLPTARNARGLGGRLRTGVEVTSQMVTKSGPTQSFKLELPTTGTYNVWAQFGVGGEITTVPFTFDVAPKTTATQTAATAPDKVVGKAQKITLSLPLDYRAQAATVKAGEPVALTFKLTEDAGCGNTISLPAAKWTKTLKVGESATVIYMPTQSGALNFQCGMGHMKGTLLVK